MKRILLLMTSAVMCVTAHALDTDDQNHKRAIRHFLYQAVENGVTLRLSAEQKAEYLTIMREHVNYAESKLHGTAVSSSTSKKESNAAKDAPSCNRVAICSLCSAVLVACVNNGYSVIKGCIDTLTQERDQLSAELAQLKEAIARTVPQEPAPVAPVAPMTIKDLVKPMLHRILGVPMAEPQVAPVAQPEPVTIELQAPTPLSETPSLPAAFIYTVTSAVVAYQVLKYTYNLAIKLMHTTDHLIETIEKDKAVIAYLESSY